MFSHLIEANYISDYKIRLKFSDGKSGIVDLVNELKGTIFEPLKEIKYFKSFELDKNADTIVWKNGADFAPEFLYEQINKYLSSI
jgi:hypothetical protein